MTVVSQCPWGRCGNAATPCGTRQGRKVRPGISAWQLTEPKFGGEV